MGGYTDRLARRGRPASEIPDDGVVPPFKFTEDPTTTDGDRERFKCDSVWVSGRYTVFVRRDHPTGWARECECCSAGDGPDFDCARCAGSGHVPMTVTHLSIKRNDREAIHDWRDFQIIKNVFCGEVSEGIEIYPAEERLVDTSNQYHLWVFPKGERIPVGFSDGRLVSESKFGNAKQRPFELAPDDAVDDAELRKMAIVYCESKGIVGKAARDILGGEPSREEVVAVYDAMTNEDLDSISSTLNDRRKQGLDPGFVHSRLAIIESLLERRSGPR
jgi:hypothetical protein